MTMGQRPFKELPEHKRISILYRDTRRLRWLTEQELGEEITDAEWLRVVGTLPKHTVRIVDTMRLLQDKAAEDSLEAEKISA